MTDQWTTKTSMPTARVLLPVGDPVVNNKIYAIGGLDESDLVLATVEEGTISGSLPAWNNLPTANAGLDKTATAGYTVAFNGSGSDYEEDALSYAWDFDYQGGVFTQDATGQSVSHTYTTAGTYAVVLQVTDSKGAWNRDSLTVTVNPGPSVVTFAKAYGGGGYDQAYYSAKQTSDGGFIVAASTNSFGAGGEDAFFFKLDSSGNVVWKKTFGGGGSIDRANTVQQLSDGGFIVAGSTNSFGATGVDLLLLRLDSLGMIQWKKTFGGTGTEEAYSVQQTSDGGIILTGVTNSFGAGGADAHLIKLDSSGNIVWKKTFGGGGNDWANSVQQTSDGGFIVAGITYSFGAGSGDVLLLKLDSSGNIPGCSALQDITGGTVTDPALSEGSSFTVSESVPSANLVDITGGTETDPNITVTVICN